MRLLRHLTCCFPITKTQIWKSNEKILYISIEKNNFSSNKRSHLVPNASYVNKHDWFDATPISCIHRWFDWNYNILLLELINSNNNKCIVEFSTWKPIVIAFVTIPFSSSSLSFSLFFFLIKNACFEIINLSASKRTGYQFQFESTFRVSLARSTIFGRFNGDPREHWT